LTLQLVFAPRKEIYKGEEAQGEELRGMKGEGWRDGEGQRGTEGLFFAPKGDLQRRGGPGRGTEREMRGGGMTLNEGGREGGEEEGERERGKEWR
jgi:hypothetical protein